MLDKHEIEIAIGDWVTFYTERGIPENVNWRTGYVINIKDNQAFVCDGDPRVSDWKESKFRNALWLSSHAIQKA